jgi:putative PIN family toxin of toxin-antitoxin system
VRVLLDTNVLIAAFIAHGTCHDLFLHVTRHRQLVSSRYILDELVRNLTGKFRFSKKDSLEVASLIRERAELASAVEVEPRFEIDHDDLPILGAAVAGSCQCLVTGDKEFLKLEQIERIPILPPSQFWKFEDRSTTPD